MEHIHTKIDSPLELRKQILESAIDADDMMKNCNSIKQMVDDKDLFFNQIKELLKNLRSEVERFHDSLPPLPQEFKEEPKKKVEQKSNKYSSYMNEREKLEKGLDDIRKRMANVTAR